MKLISHRGNLEGPDSTHANNPAQIKTVLGLGFDCEVDVRLINGHFLLGHDERLYPVKESFLEKDGLWCHAKNLSGLEKMLENGRIHCFWHENDDYTLTSRGYIWTFPNTIVCKKSIIVDDNSNWRDKNYNCFGVCTDYIL